MKSNFLLIEDDMDHAELIRRAMNANDRELTLKHAISGEEALQLLHRAADYPDAILLDLNLPRLSGHDVLTRLKADERYSVIPVIVLTTSTNNADRLLAYQNHANSYLVKPPNLAEFRQLLDVVCEYWTNCNKRAQNQ